MAYKSLIARPKVTHKWNFWIEFTLYTCLEPFIFEVKDSLPLLDRNVRGSLSENHSFTKGADSSEWLRVERSVNWREYWWQRDPRMCWVSLRPEVVLMILFFYACLRNTVTNTLQSYLLLFGCRASSFACKWQWRLPFLREETKGRMTKWMA